MIHIFYNKKGAVRQSEAPFLIITTSNMRNFIYLPTTTVTPLRLRDQDSSLSPRATGLSFP